MPRWIDGMRHMADQISQGSADGWWSQARLRAGERLVGRRALLAVVALVLAGLVALAGLSAGGALLGYAAIVASAILLPHLGETEAPGGAVDVEPTGLRDETARDVADALVDPCIILDRRSVVLHRNPAASGQFPALRTGDPLAFTFRYPALLTAVDAARRTGISQSVELHQTVPHETWHRVHISPFGLAGLEEGEEAPRLIITMQTLTEMKRVEALRSDFIADVSHELRTPLTSLIGFIDTLLGPAAKDPQARQKFLGIMRAQAERMSKLVNDLLSLSRIEMHQHVRPTGTVDLAQLLREIKDGLQTQAQEAGATIELAMPEGSCTMAGDKDELYEVFENLVDNAIKYGREGGHVAVSLAPAPEPSGYHFQVSVTDDGPGIAEEHVPRLTERFYRVDADNSRKKKGTGLGLAIVKHIVSRHRGSLSIRSRPGEGTRVEVLLPR